MTDNKYWLYLENLRRSGVVNMYGATPYLQGVFFLSRNEAISILSDWMKNYKREDYEGFEKVRFCDICGMPISQGYYIAGTYYCSPDCLHSDYTDEEYEEMYGDEAYWTEWEEEVEVNR